LLIGTNKKVTQNVSHQNSQPPQLNAHRPPSTNLPATGRPRAGRTADDFLGLKQGTGSCHPSREANLERCHYRDTLECNPDGDRELRDSRLATRCLLSPPTTSISSLTTSACRGTMKWWRQIRHPQVASAKSKHARLRRVPCVAVAPISHFPWLGDEWVLISTLGSWC